MNKQHIIGATIIICSIIFIVLPFLSPHSDSVRALTLPSSILIETDDNISIWQDNIFGDPNGLMKYFDEKNETWWLWSEYNPEGLSYVISIKSGQVLKVSYEVGAFRPFRFSFWGMKDPEKEPFQSRHAGVTDTPLV